MVLLPKKWKIYKKAIDLWGLPCQIIMLGEEQGELFKVVSKLARKGGQFVKADLAEELADNEIMMEQMQIAFSIPRWQIDEFKKMQCKAIEEFHQIKEQCLQPKQP